MKSVVLFKGAVIRSLSILFLRPPNDRDDSERGKSERNAGDDCDGCGCGVVAWLWSCCWMFCGEKWRWWLRCVLVFCDDDVWFLLFAIALAGVGASCWLEINKKKICKNLVSVSIGCWGGTKIFLGINCCQVFGCIYKNVQKRVISSTILC